MAFKGSVQIKKGTYGPETTLMSNLTANQLNRPVIRDFLEYADKRSISTLLTSGAVGPYGVNVTDTKIGKVDASRKIGSLGYQFDVMGSIQIPSEINRQVGATLSDGTFKLSLKDNYLYPGQIAVFNGAGFQARVMGNPTGGTGNWIYEFQSPDGTLFDWTTHVAGQGALKTVFGATSTYGEYSKRGYGRTHYPDSFVVHMTLQRKTIGISGDAATQVLWYEYTSDDGLKAKGWRFEQERQAKAQFTVENEYQKWFGKSTMKNDNGTLRTTSRMIDREAGNEITSGDGIWEQLLGGNEFIGTGINGFATAEDFADALSVMRKESNEIEGRVMVFVCGEDGMSNARVQMQLLPGIQNVQLVQIVNQSMEKGGAKVGVGFNWIQYNVDGDTIYFVRHPMFDNRKLFSAVAADNKSIMSGTYIGLTMEVEGRKNVEILSKGAYGADRSMIEIYLNGLSGLTSAGATVSEEDGTKFAMLRQDLIVAYNTKECCIIHKRAS